MAYLRSGRTPNRAKLLPEGLQPVVRLICPLSLRSVAFIRHAQKGDSPVGSVAGSKTLLWRGVHSPGIS